MNNIHPRFFLMLLAMTFLISCQQTSHQSMVLFDQDNNDWFSSGDSLWSFDQDILTGTALAEGGFVMTKSRYSDFVLELEFLPDSTINSGVFIRCGKKELSATDCFEINIWDLHPNQDFRTGAVVSRSTPMAYVETINQWNTYKIRCRDNKVEAWINQIKVAELQDDYPSEGYIGLQAARKGSIQFRNVSLKLLEKGKD